MAAPRGKPSAIRREIASSSSGVTSICIMPPPPPPPPASPPIMACMCMCVHVHVHVRVHVARACAMALRMHTCSISGLIPSCAIASGDCSISCTSGDCISCLPPARTGDGAASKGRSRRRAMVPQVGDGAAAHRQGDAREMPPWEHGRLAWPQDIAPRRRAKRAGAKRPARANEATLGDAARARAKKGGRVVVWRRVGSLLLTAAGAP